MSNEQLRLGGETDKPVGTIDAFHVPCVRVWCAEAIKQGTEVVFIAKDRVVPHQEGDVHDVVDPFAGDLEPEENFWVLVKPELVKGLRHDVQIEIENSDIFHTKTTDEIFQEGYDKGHSEGYDEGYDFDDGCCGSMLALC